MQYAIQYVKIQLLLHNPLYCIRVFYPLSQSSIFNALYTFRFITRQELWSEYRRLRLQSLFQQCNMPRSRHQQAYTLILISKYKGGKAKMQNGGETKCKNSGKRQNAKWRGDKMKSSGKRQNTKMAGTIFWY